MNGKEEKEEKIGEDWFLFFFRNRSVSDIALGCMYL
jgi:hypothetical protein